MQGGVFFLTESPSVLNGVDGGWSKKRLEASHSKALDPPSYPWWNDGGCVVEDGENG